MKPTIEIIVNFNEPRFIFEGLQDMIYGTDEEE
jgi:hypothetical protein